MSTDTLAENSLPVNSDVGAGTIIEEGATIGFRYRADCGKAIVGRESILRAGSIIYGDVEFGDFFQTGHYVVVRANVKGGDYCCILNQSTIEGNTQLGSGVRIMSHVYIPTTTVIGNNTFIGPGVTMLNDKYAGRYQEIGQLEGPKIGDNVVIGGGSTLLPGIKIGNNAFIAAGTVVSKNVPERMLAIGNPMQIRELPEDLDIDNCQELIRNKRDLWHPLG